MVIPIGANVNKKNGVGEVMKDSYKREEDGVHIQYRIFPDILIFVLSLFLIS